MTIVRLARPLLFACGLAALFCAPARAQNNVTLENLSIAEPGAKSVLTIARVEVIGTNLTRDEVAELFSANATSQAVVSAMSRLAAERVVISGAQVKGEEGRISFGTFTATAIHQGRFRKAVLDGIEADIRGAGKGSEGTLVSRPMELENGDLGPVLAAAQKGDIDGSQVFQVERLDWRGFEARFVDTDVAASAPGGNISRVTLGSVIATTDYDGAVPRRMSGEAKGLVIEPAPASEMGRQLKAFGYERLELGFTGSATYDAAKRELALQNYALSGAGAGELSLSGRFTGIAPELVAGGDKDMRAAAVLAASIADLQLRFVNTGLVEKSLAFAAAQQGKTPAVLKSEAAAMSGQILPLLLGGEPSALALAQSVQAFIKDPRSFTLRLKARGTPVPVMSLAALGNPATLFALVEVSLVANP